MNATELEMHIKAAMEAIKGDIAFAKDKRIVSELGFESIDIIDLFFELQKRTAIEADLNEVAAQIGGGQKFNDITANDVIRYLLSKSQ